MNARDHIKTIYGKKFAKKEMIISENISGIFANLNKDILAPQYARKVPTRP